MKRYSVLAVALGLISSACGSSSAAPSSPSQPTFTVTMSPANEVPPVTGPEASGSGTGTITIATTKDGAGNITSASATFVINLTGFPPGTPINAAHIHAGAPGCACPVVVSTGITAGANVLTNGSGTLTVGGINVTPEVAQAILNNPAGYYFNVHSTLNPGGFCRGPLVRM
jgi:hypothetical protein